MAGCSKCPEQNQISLYPESEIQSMAFDQYHQFLHNSKIIPVSGNHDAEMVDRVGKNLTQAITDYYGNGIIKELQGYQWEYPGWSERRRLVYAGRKDRGIQRPFVCYKK